MTKEVRNTEFERAQALRNNGEIEKAVDLYMKIRTEGLVSDAFLASECLHMIGVAYYQDRNYAKAEEALRGSQKEFEKLGQSESVGFVLRDRGMNARSNKDLEKAKRFLGKSVNQLSKTGNKGHEGISRVKLGRVHADEGNFEKALDEINRGIELLSGSSEKFFWSSCFLDRAKVYAQMGKKEKAREDASESLRILNSLYKGDEFLMRRRDIDDLLKQLDEK